MLFLLRNIRRKLISSDNKALTYLLYAIGEIVLVVVGILIAVQIDSWNDQRKDRRIVSNLLVNLKAELEYNKNNLTSDSISLSRAINSGFELLKAIEEKIVLDEEHVDGLIFDLIVTPTTSLSQGTVLDIISSGKVDLIRNDTLRSLLLAFGSKVDDIRESQRLNNELLHMSMIPYLYDHFAFVRMDHKFQSFGMDWPRGRFHSDLEIMFNDRKFETLLDDSIYRNLTLIRLMTVTNSDLNLSLDLVKNELDK